MKKFAVLVLALILCTTFLSGCGADPVAEELEQFLSIDMLETNRLHADVSSETKKWESFKKDKEAIESIENVLLPNFDEILKNLSTISLGTAEVKAIKEKYQQSINLYKEGYEIFLEAFKAGDADLVSAASEKIRQAETLLKEYHSLTETLAKEKEIDLR